MPESWSSYPVGVAFALLFVIAMLRGQATYWLARVITGQALARSHPAGGWRARTHDWLSGASHSRGREIIRRHGALSIPFCYLTVGLQTVVLASAGVVRLPWPRFTFAQVFGALAWATVYSTVGLALWIAVLQGHPLLVAGAALMIVAGGVLLLRARRTRRARLAQRPVVVAPALASSASMTSSK